MDETLEQIFDRLKITANKTGKTQSALQETPGGEVVVSVEPDIKKYQRWGIPKLYIDCDFSTFKGNEKLIKDISKALSEKSHVVLIGNTGCGKTHLSISALKEHNAAESWGKRFTSTQELLLDIRESFRPSAKQSESDIIDKYTSYDVLVLDDLGSEKTSEYSITTLYLIIDRRLRDCKPTIITTNLTLKEIEEKISARIASRLSAMKVFKINMPDYRKKR